MLRSTLFSMLAQAEYTIPGDLTLLATWHDGYSAEETLKFPRAYGNDTLTGPAPRAATSASEFRR